MSQNNMAALVYEGPSTMNIRTVPISEPDKNELQICVKRAGICGSELSGYLGHNSLRKPPLVMGHEFAGVVSAMGENVRKFKLGDRVTVNPLVSCGSCLECKSGHAHLCESRQLIGAARPGAFAEYVNVPEENTLPLPDSLSMDKGAMVEPFACAVHAARLAQMTAADKLLIIGAGPIGLFVLQAAQILGVKTTVVQDINSERLKIVKALGGIPVSSPEELQRDTPSNGFTVTVDAVGLDVTRQQCIEAARPGGRVVLIGLHAAESPIPVNLAIRNELALYGSFAYSPLDFEMALEWMSERQVDLTPWVKYAPLEEGNACFQELLRDAGSIAKILLKLSDE